MDQENQSKTVEISEEQWQQMTTALDVLQNDFQAIILAAKPIIEKIGPLLEKFQIDPSLEEKEAEKAMKKAMVGMAKKAMGHITNVIASGKLDEKALLNVAGMTEEDMTRLQASFQRISKLVTHYAPVYASNDKSESLSSD